jgi:hypothetical protein
MLTRVDIYAVISTRFEGTIATFSTSSFRPASSTRSSSATAAVDLRDQLPTICTTPKVLSKFANKTVTFQKAYDTAVSSGGENVNLNQIKRFRTLICKPETEGRLVDSDTKARKVAVYELRKIAARIKHLLIKLES